MLFRLTFRRTKEDCLHVVAHPDSSRQGAHVLVADHTDPPCSPLHLYLQELALNPSRRCQSQH